MLIQSRHVLELALASVYFLTTTTLSYLLGKTSLSSKSTISMPAQRLTMLSSNVVWLIAYSVLMLVFGISRFVSGLVHAEDEERGAILQDLFYYTLSYLFEFDLYQRQLFGIDIDYGGVVIRYAKDHGYNPEQTSTFFSLVKEIHTMTIGRKSQSHCNQDLHLCRWKRIMRRLEICYYDIAFKDHLIVN